MALTLPLLLTLAVTASAEDGSNAPEPVTDTVEGLPSEEGEAGEDEGVPDQGVGRSSEPTETPIPFTMVGFEVPEGSEVWFRTSVDGEDWTEWTDAPVLDAQDGPDDGSEEDREANDWDDMTHPIWVGEAGWLQTSVLGGDPEEVTAHLIDADGLSQSLTQRVSSSVRNLLSRSTPEAQAVSRPGIVSRSQWGANESWAGTPSYRSNVRAGVVHHTAGSNSYSRSQSAGIVRGIYHYHSQTLGWKDIGYNILIDRYGTIYEGRKGGLDRGVIGAHAQGFNTGTFGVSLMGNFQSSTPPKAALDSLERVIAWQSSEYDLNPTGSVTITSGGSNKYSSGRKVTLPTIFGHNDVGLTACPGARVTSRMPTIRSNAKSLMNAASQPSVDVGWDEPANGATVTGDTRLRASVDGSASALRYVVFFVDGVWVGNNYGSPWDMTWDSSTVDDGEREITVVGVDTAENRLTSKRKVTVDNRLFTDLGSTAHQADILWAADSEITNGCRDRQYCPGEDVTRQQMASFLVRASKGLSPRSGQAFSDTPVSVVHTPDVNGLAHAGLTKGCGDGTTFCPKENVTRGEMASFLARALDLSEGSGSTFSDVPSNDSHAGNIAAIADLGITEGYKDGQFRPYRPVSRAEMATFIRRAVSEGL